MGTATLDATSVGLNVPMWTARGPCGCIVAAELDRTDREERINLACLVGHWMMDGLIVERSTAPVRVGHDFSCKFGLGGR